MATYIQRLRRKNSSGSYDTIHLETSAKAVITGSGGNVEDSLSMGSMGGDGGGVLYPITQLVTSGTVGIGNTVTMGGEQWIVIHTDHEAREVWFMTKNLPEICLEKNAPTAYSAYFYKLDKKLAAAIKRCTTEYWKYSNDATIISQQVKLNRLTAYNMEYTYDYTKYRYNDIFSTVSDSSFISATYNGKKRAYWLPDDRLITNGGTGKDHVVIDVNGIIKSRSQDYSENGDLSVLKEDSDGTYNESAQRAGWSAATCMYGIRPVICLPF